MMKTQETSRSHHLAILIGISISVHLLVLLLMNVHNTQVNAQSLIHPTVIQLDEILPSGEGDHTAVSALNPTMFASLSPGSDTLQIIYPDLSSDGESSIQIISSEGEPFSILIEDTHASFTLRAGERIVGQNTSAGLPGYTPNRAYAVFSFSRDDYEVSTEGYTMDLGVSAQYRTTGMRDNAYFLISSTDAVNFYIIKRLMAASIIFGGYMLLLLVSAVIFFRFPSNYILVTISMGLVMTLRFILLGEYPLFASLQLQDPALLFLSDYFLAVMIFLLTQLLAASLSRFRIPKKLTALYSLLFVVVEMFAIMKGYLYVTFAMNLLGILVTIFMTSRTRSEYRGYSILILITYSIFSTSVTHQILLYMGQSVRGVSIEMIFTNQFSALVYIGSVLYAVSITNIRRLRELEREKQAFERSIMLRGISHDLKLPISVIRLRTQMRGSYELSPEESRAYDSVILQATHELEEMTENINAYLHAVADTEEEGECRILEELRVIEQRYCQYGDERQISFEAILDETERTIPTTSLKFERMISNLIDNAFKYTPDGGSVILRYTHARELLISVEDTGVGMSPQDIELIMKPFFQLDSSRNSKGSGLGLSVVKAVADSLKAEILIDSRPREGTRVTLLIPNNKKSL